MTPEHRSGTAPVIGIAFAPGAGGRQDQLGQGKIDEVHCVNTPGG